MKEMYVVLMCKEDAFDEYLVASSHYRNPTKIINNQFIVYFETCYTTQFIRYITICAYIRKPKKKPMQQSFVRMTYDCILNHVIEILPDSKSLDDDVFRFPIERKSLNEPAPSL